MVQALPDISLTPSYASLPVAGPRVQISVTMPLIPTTPATFKLVVVEHAIDQQKCKQIVGGFGRSSLSQPIRALPAVWRLRCHSVPRCVVSTVPV